MAERRESVRIELIDSGFSTGMVKAAASTGLLERALKSLDGTNVVVTERISKGATGIDSLSKSSRDADGSINQLTGRLRLFADAAAILGPSIAPVGGVLVAGVAGLANQMGVAAIAGGVLIGSMQGLGDAFKALHEAELEPTAENLAAVKDALNDLSPAAADFATEAYGMLDVLKSVRDAGAEGLFPGLTDSLDDLERLAPVVANIFNQVGSALGDIAADGAASLASDRWRDFFDFLAAEGPRTLSDLATTVGDLTHGLSELWMAFSPLNNSFSGWLMDVADGFDSWATGLAQTEGFADFVDYIRTTGPQVAETFGSLANAVLQVVEAAAPLGGPVLAAIEGLADALAIVADSNVGTSLIATAAGFAAVTRAMSLFNSAKSSSLALMMTDLAKNGEQAGAGARALGIGLGTLLAIPALDSAQTQFSGLSTGLNALSRDLLSLGSSGSLSAEFDNLSESLTRLSDPNLAQALQDNIYDKFGFLGSDSRVDEATAQFEALDDALVNIVTTQGPAQAEEALKNLAASMGLTADQTKDLVALLPGYKDAIVQVDDAANSAAADQTYRNSLEAESSALEKNIGLMQAKRDEALRSFSAETNYAQSLLDAKAALEENGRVWNKTSDEGLKNRRVVEGQASAWNELNRQQGQTPAQARQARKALEDTAVSLGASKEEARRYARQLLDIPNDLTTKIALDIDTATQRAKAIKAELASIDRNIDVYVNVRRPNAGGFGPQVGASADGGSVPKTGKPYADRHLYLLADGEEVVSNRHGQADRHRSLLKDINANRLAAGGTTGTKGDKKKPVRGAAFYATDNTDALQAAIDRLADTQRAQTEALEESTSQQEYWASKMSDLAQATVSGFNTGLFEMQQIAGDSDVWAAGARGPRTEGGVLENLAKDIAGLTERGNLQAQLASMGLSGDTLAALLSQGSNSDISALINSGQVGQYADLYGQRANLQASVGAGANSAAGYAQQAAAAAAETAALRAEAAKTNMQLARLETAFNRNTAAVERMEQDAPERTGAAVGREINSGAATAQRTKQTGVRRG